MLEIKDLHVKSVPRRPRALYIEVLLFVLAIALRLWVIATLAEYWNVQVK